MAGFECSRREGLNKALFKVRTSDTICRLSPSGLYSFFLGAVLCGDVTAILPKARGKIIIGGKQQLKDALYLLLTAASDLEIIRLTPEETDESVALGAIRIYEWKD